MNYTLYQNGRPILIVQDGMTIRLQGGVYEVHSTIHVPGKLSIQGLAAANVAPLQVDWDRARIKTKNKDDWRTWTSTKSGRPFHLRKWYR